MKEIYIFYLLMHVLMPCIAFYASARIKITDSSLDTTAALKQVAETLNVPEPGNWNTFMDPSSTSGSTGQAQVGTGTLANVMAGWPIPDQFRAQAVQSVNMLVLAAAEGSYSAQAFVFDSQAGTSLWTLIIVTKQLDSPADQNSPIGIAYVSINSNTVVKQQVTRVPGRNCHKCIKCAWLSKCCCDDVVNDVPRGLTPEEIEIVRNKMKFDQFSWYNQQSFTVTLKKRDASNDGYNNRDASLTRAIEKFLSSNIVKAEVLTPYNDSVLSALQSNIGSLKLSSQSLKMTKVASTNLRTVLSTLAKDYAFENAYNSPQFEQQLEKGRFSYENLYTTSTNDDNNNNKEIDIKYIWLVGQSVDKSTYSVNFLSVNITSQVLIETLLSNDTTTTTDQSSNNKKKQLKIVRTATLNDNGEFSNEDLPTMITSWTTKRVKTALNMLRFMAASALYPHNQQMLSYFNIKTSSLGGSFNTNEPRVIGEKIIALSKAVSAAAGAWKDVVSAFKTSSSTTITRVTRFGFNYFSHKSTVLKAIDIPAAKADAFINAITIDYNLPTQGSFALALEYSSDFAWDRIDYLYSPKKDGKYRSLTLFKNGDSVSNTASFFIVDVNADWELAPDLLIIQKSKSILGGLFESSKQSIQEVPHVLTLEEATKLQQFFMLIAMNNIASTIGATAPLPDLN